MTSRLQNKIIEDVKNQVIDEIWLGFSFLYQAGCRESDFHYAFKGKVQALEWLTDFSVASDGEIKDWGDKIVCVVNKLKSNYGREIRKLEFYEK